MDKLVPIIGGFLIVVAVAVAAAIIIGGFSGCNTFKVIQVEGEEKECNDFYTILNFYAEQAKGKGNADSAFIGTVYNECKMARAEKRKAIKEKHCQEMIFGKDVPVDKNHIRYVHYLECTR